LLLILVVECSCLKYVVIVTDIGKWNVVV